MISRTTYEKPQVYAFSVFYSHPKVAQHKNEISQIVEHQFRSLEVACRIAADIQELENRMVTIVDDREGR